MSEQARRGWRRTKVVGDTDAFTQAITFAVGPVLFGVLGRLADAQFGTAPLFVLVGILAGFGGGAATLYYRYQARMREHEDNKPWRKLAHAAADAGKTVIR